MISGMSDHTRAALNVLEAPFGWVRCRGAVRAERDPWGHQNLPTDGQPFLSAAIAASDGRSRLQQSATRRFLCEPRLSRPSWCAVLRAAGVGQGGAPAAKRGRTTLTNPRAGADWRWA